MRRGKFASALTGALIIAAGVALGAASPPIQSSTMPPVGGHAEVDQFKALSDRVQKLEQDNAMKAAQIATLNAQINAMKTSMNLMQAAITTLQNRANASVPVAAPATAQP